MIIEKETNSSPIYIRIYILLIRNNINNKFIKKERKKQIQHENEMMFAIIHTSVWERVEGEEKEGGERESESEREILQNKHIHSLCAFEWDSRLRLKHHPQTIELHNRFSNCFN